MIQPSLCILWSELLQWVSELCIDSAPNSYSVLLQRTVPLCILHCINFKQNMQSGLDPFASTPSTILCCMCGTPIVANPANMCSNCIKSRVDITQNIIKQLTVTWCRQCARYMVPPNGWVRADPESPELLAFLLKRIKGLNKLRLVDAALIWTEPHSKRLKVRIKVQQEVFAGAILQQTANIEFVVMWTQCPSCGRLMSDQTWRSVVQVRQHVTHKRTFLLLEQMILKHHMHTHCVSIKEQSEGIDFYFNSKHHSTAFVSFLQASTRYLSLFRCNILVVPCHFKYTEKLVSHEEQSNTANLLTSFAVEVAPVCREDLIVINKKQSIAFGGSTSPFMLCAKVGNVIQLVDPYTFEFYHISNEVYWKSPLESCLDVRSLKPFYVVDVEILGPRYGKFMAADVQLWREHEIGSGNIITTRTHLGHLLKAGDAVLGYDFANTNFSNIDQNAITAQLLNSDVMIVKKYYPESHRNRSRIWKLKRMNVEKEEEQAARASRRLAEQQAREEQDYEDFLRELEEDKDLRSTINLYKDEERINERKQTVPQSISFNSNISRDNANVNSFNALNTEGNESQVTQELDIGIEELLDELTMEEEQYKDLDEAVQAEESETVEMTE